MVTAKVYCVHLISTVGFHLIFQDVDVVVSQRSDYLKHSVDLAKRLRKGDKESDVDMFLERPQHASAGPALVVQCRLLLYPQE